MLTFNWSRFCSRLTTGTQYGPMAAGVRSIRRMPGLIARRKASFLTWAPADVASNTKSMSLNTSMRVRPSTPSWVIATPMRAARARPSEAGSMPTIAPISRCRALRRILIIRSVPILPEPMMATLSFLFIIVASVARKSPITRRCRVARSPHRHCRCLRYARRNDHRRPRPPSAPVRRSG